MKYILLFILSISSLTLLAQTSFTAECNSSQVVVGAPFEVSYKLSNGKYKSFTAPSFANFETHGPPSQGSSFTYTNGKMVSSETRTYVLSAQKPGNFKIGAALATTQSGKKLKSNPIKLAVVKSGDNNAGEGNNPAAPTSDQVFLRTELSNTEAVVGEQIVVDYKLYTQININQVDIVKEPQIENVFKQYIRIYDDRTKVESVNGKQYKTRILRRMVIFPSKSGEVKLDAAAAQIGIAVGQPTFFNPFPKMQAYNVLSKPVTINVSSLDGTPGDFSGAVGQYAMQAHVEKPSISSDDVVQLTIRIRGQGDIKQVLPPKILLPKEFEVFPPNTKEDVREGEGVLGGIKEMKYIITPKAIGDLMITPKFIYFDPNQRRFITRDTTIKVTITQGSNPLPKIGAVPDKPKEVIDTSSTAALTLGKPQPNTILEGPRKPFFGSIIFWGLCILPFIGWGLAIIVRNRKDQVEEVDESEQKQKFASQEANSRLAVAKKHLDSKNNRAFYEAISQALWGYASDKFKIPVAELTKETIRNKFGEVGISEELIKEFNETIETCEMAMFAGMSEADSIDKAYSNAGKLIKSIEETIA